MWVLTLSCQQRQYVHCQCCHSSFFIFIFCCQEYLFFNEAFRPVLPVSGVACWLGEVLNCCCWGVGRYVIKPSVAASVTRAQCKLLEWLSGLHECWVLLLLDREVNPTSDLGLPQSCEPDSEILFLGGSLIVVWELLVHLSVRDVFEELYPHWHHLYILFF